MRQQPFASPTEALEHHGVKGMRWGVRKEDESVDKTRAAKEIAKTNEVTKEYMAELHKQQAKKVSPAENQKLIEENYKKHLTKDQPSEGDEGKGLSPTQKKLLIGAGIGVGAAVAIGGAYAYSKYGGKKPPVDWRQLDRVVKPGDKVTAEEYQKLIQQSIKGSFGWPPMVKDSSFTRPAFELPAGHTFYRLSRNSEIDFNALKDGTSTGTYAVHSVEDLNRYIQGFSSEKGLGKHSYNVITWQAKQPIKVPNLTTVLETLRETRPELSRGEALREYQRLSGGGWVDHSGVPLMQALERKGYSAIFDELDGGVYAESPLVMFNNSNYTSKVTTPLTDQAIQKAKTSLTEISNRKLSDAPFTQTQMLLDEVKRQKEQAVA